MSDPHAYRTPGTCLCWADIAGWCATAHIIDRRRYSAARNAALKAHAAALPLTLIAVGSDAAALEAALDLLKDGPQGLARPQRGARADAPRTPRIMALHNRLAVLRRRDEMAPGAHSTKGERHDD